MKKPALKKIAFAVITTSIVVLSFPAFAGLRTAGPAENWTITQINNETTDVSNTINTFGTSLLTTLKLNFERLMSALNVATKQEALSSGDFKQSTVSTMTAFVNALRAQNQTAAVTKAYLDYNPMTGQGYDPCGTALRNKALDKAYSVLHSNAASTMKKIPLLQGSLTDTAGSWQEQQVANHRQKFCTQTEADAGLCSLSKVPGGDTNAALFFKSVDDNSLEKEARTAYINNLMGAPLEKIHGNPSNENSKQYLFEQNRYISMASIPAYSLSMIDAENTRDASTKVSPTEQLNNRINTYFGGKEALKWASSMSTQTPRGLLVEMAKIEGLAAWQNFKVVEQNNRILANIAALGLASSEPAKKNLEDKVNKAVGTASSNAITGGIK